MKKLSISNRWQARARVQQSGPCGRGRACVRHLTRILPLLLCAELAAAQSSGSAQPIPATPRNAGVLHLATGTWTRHISGSSAFGPQTIYNNNAPTGYFAFQDAHERQLDEGRLPSTSSIAPMGSADIYRINGLQFGYCTDDPSPQVTLSFWDRTQPCLASAPGPEAPLTHLDLLTGLPGGSGSVACWVVTVDLDGSGEEFCMRADGDGVYDGDPTLDSFGWMFDIHGTSPGNDGPLICGDPANAGFGDGTSFQAPSSIGTGLGTQDFYWYEDDSGANALGCYWFGGYPANPYGSFWLQLYAQSGSQCAQPEVIQPVTLEQVSWDTSASGQVQDSEYGQISFNYVPGSGPLFLNLLARFTSGGPVGWMIQNMALPGEDATDERTTRTGMVVDLGKLGVTRGQDVSGQSVSYMTVLSATPLLSQPSFSPSWQTLLSSKLFNFGDELSIIPLIQDLASPGSFSRPPWNGSLNGKLVWRKTPNGEQGKNQCGPSALTNSMHWMQSVYWPLVRLPLQTWNITLDKFKTYTNFDPLGGIGQRDAIEGKLRFALDPGKHFLPDLIVKYQADGNLTDLGASVTVNGKTARRVGPSAPPSFGWLLGELQNGEDVEVSIDWLDAAGQKTGGHVASVVGAAVVGNKLYAWTNDDACQGPKTGTPAIPPKNGGLRTNLFHQVTISPSGHMQFSGFGTPNRIKATYSESLGIEFWTRYCTVTVNSTGFPALLVAEGSNSIAANDLVLTATSVPFNQFGIIYYGPNQIQIPFGNGFRCVGGSVWRLPVHSSGATGELVQVIDYNNPPAAAAQITAGSTWNFQCWFRDPLGGGAFFNLSDALSIPFVP